jgi:hypothetical protein
MLQRHQTMVGKRDDDDDDKKIIIIIFVSFLSDANLLSNEVCAMMLASKKEGSRSINCKLPVVTQLCSSRVYISTPLWSASRFSYIRLVIFSLAAASALQMNDDLIPTRIKCNHMENSTWKGCEFISKISHRDYTLSYIFIRSTIFTSNRISSAWVASMEIPFWGE